MRAPLTDKTRAEAGARAAAERASTAVPLAIGAVEAAGVLKALRSATGRPRILRS